ncbi:MAG: hypothetical protein WC045_00125 [Patescibacteria group bacterium]
MNGESLQLLDMEKHIKEELATHVRVYFRTSAAIRMANLAEATRVATYLNDAVLEEIQTRIICGGESTGMTSNEIQRRQIAITTILKGLTPQSGNENLDSDRVKSVVDELYVLY